MTQIARNISVVRDICCYLLIPASVQSVKSDVFYFTTEDANFHKKIRVTIFVFFCVFCCFYILCSLYFRFVLIQIRNSKFGCFLKNFRCLFLSCVHHLTTEPRCQYLLFASSHMPRRTASGLRP